MLPPRLLRSAFEMAMELADRRMEWVSRFSSTLHGFRVVLQKNLVDMS